MEEHLASPCDPSRYVTSYVRIRRHSASFSCPQPARKRKSWRTAGGTRKWTTVSLVAPCMASRQYLGHFEKGAYWL